MPQYIQSAYPSAGHAVSGPARSLFIRWKESEMENFCIRIGKQLSESSSESVKLLIAPSCLEGHLEFLKTKKSHHSDPHAFPPTSLLGR